MRGIIAVVTLLLLAVNLFGALDAYIDDAVAKKTVPHAVVLVERNGEVVFEKAAGGAKREDIYALASTSKPIAATAILTLADQGKLSLDDPVAKYFPAFREASTVRQLLSHTSGIFGNNDVERLKLIRDPQQLLADAVEKVLLEPLSYKPGEAYRYGGASFCVAGRIAEKITGEGFDAFAKRVVFTPAGMKTAAYKGRFVLVPGGISCNADDLLRFARTYPKLISAKARGEMTTKQTGSLKQNYGLGWQLLDDGAYGHGGAFGTYLYIDPERKITVAVMTSTERASGFAAEVLKRLPK
jgi:CubicO group peptidase (beta-lactamase class C family)